jgi:hypothetical protein
MKVAAEKMEVLLEIDRFGVDRGMEMTMIQIILTSGKYFGRECLLSELDRIAIIGAFKELGERVRARGGR